MCQEQCQDQQSHQEDCQLFQRSQIFPKADQLESSHGIYSFISVLRILLLKTTDKARWQIVEEMMDHWGDRSKDKRVVEGIITMTIFLNFLQGGFKKAIGYVIPKTITVRQM